MPRDYSQTRHDLAQAVLAMSKSAPIELEDVLDSEADNGIKFAREAAAILAYEGETPSEYAYRVQTWLLGLCEKHITDSMCKAFEDECDRDAAVEAEVDRRRDEVAA